MACAWARRNCAQDGPARRGEGSIPVARRIVQTVEAPIGSRAGQLAVDASIAPGGVLGGQADDDGAQAGGDGGAPGPDGLGGPAAGDQLAVPAEDRRRRDE
jgi:hypothetical protein